MEQEAQRKFDSLERVPDFLDTHVDVLGSITTSDGRKEVDAAIAIVSSHAVKQGSATRTLTGQMNRQQVLGKELIASHMRPIAKFARGKLRGVPDFAALTTRVSVSSPKKLLANARTMADVAAKYTDKMVAAGLAPDTIARLTAATNAFADAIDQRAHAKALRLVSTGEIAKALAAGRDGVKVLDALITQLLPANDPLLSAWDSISRVESKKGKVRAAKPAAPATPSATSAAKPAPAVTPIVPAVSTVPSVAVAPAASATLAAPVQHG